MPTITSSTYNPRTVLSAMFNTGELKTQFYGHVYGSYNTPAIQTSDGTISTSQGVDAILNGTMSWPLYVNATVKNLTTLRRHPNQISHVFYFNKANGSFFAGQRFQEEWLGAANSWVMSDTDFTTLAWPDQNLTFDSASPGTILYTSSNFAYKNVPGVRYPGSIARYFDPTRRGTVPVNGNAKDKIVMTIRNGEMVNEFILRYDVYASTVNSGNSTAYTWIFYIDALNQRINRIIMRDAVVTAIDAVTGLVTKRTDNIDAKRMVIADRVTPSATVVSASPSTVAHGSSTTLTATVTSTAGTPNDGYVKFYDGTTLIGNGIVNNLGVATFSYTWTVAGSKTVTGKYTGNGGDWAASTSNSITVVVT